MGKASRRKQLEEQKQQFFAIHGDGRSAADRANARAMLEALQQKLEDDALREDGFCFSNGKYEDSRRARLTSGMKTRSFERHTRKVLAAEIVLIPTIQRTATEKERMLLFTFGLDSVSIWNLNTGAMMASLDVTGLHAQSICGGAVLLPEQLGAGPDARICFSYTTHHRPVVHRFDLLSSSIVPAAVTTDTFDLASSFCTGHQQPISCMAFSHDGVMLATGSWDSTCMLWEVVSEQTDSPLQHSTPKLPLSEEEVLGLTLVRIFPVHEDGVSCLAFTFDDQALVTCGECVVKLWGISGASGTVQDDENDEDGGVNQLTLGKHLQKWEEAIPFSFSIQHSMNLLAFDETLTPLIANHEWSHTRDRAGSLTLLTPVLSEQERYDLVDVRLCLDTILTTVERKNSGTSDTEEEDGENNPVGRKVKEIDNTSTCDDGASKSPEADDSEPMLTPVQHARLKAQYQSMENFDFEMLFTPALSLSAVDEGNPSSIQAKTLRRRVDHPKATKWLIREFGKTTTDGIFSSHTSTITGCAVAQELDLVVTVAFDKSVRYWSLAQGVVLETIRDAHSAPITCCALTSPTTCDLSLHEMLLATGGSDNLVKVWRRNPPLKAECVFSLAGHYDAIASAMFDPRGIFLVSTSEDTMAILWRIRPSSPEQPEVPIVVSVGRFAIDISWNEPLANGAKITHYIVRTTQVSSFAGDGSDLRHVPDTEVQAKYLTKAIDKLQPGVKYTLQVAAVNHIGSSPFSATTEPVETLAFVPSKVDGSVQHTDREATRIRLFWTPPCPNGAKILSYTIQCRPENNAFVPLREICVLVADLQQSEDLSSRIEAPEKRCRGGKRGAITTRGRTKATSRTSRGKGRSRANVPAAASTEPPAAETAGQITPTPFVTAPSSPAIAPVQLSYTVDDLWAGEVYQFVVAASNRCGQGEFSRVSDYVKMDCMAPDQPARPIIVDVGKRQVDVQWEAPRCNGSAILQYTVRWHQNVEEPGDERDDGTKSLVLLTRALTGTRCTLKGLEPGGSVQVWVSAGNLVDNKLLQSAESVGSNVADTLCDVPDAPDTPTLHDPSTHTLLLRFTVPRRNGLCIDSYDVALYSEETQFGVRVRELVREFTLSPRKLVFHPSRASSLKARPTADYTLKHLHGGTFYSVTLCARNALGSGPASAASVPTQTLPATVPAVVAEAPVITEVTPTSAVVRWSMPKHDGGAPLRGFHMEYCVRVSPTAPRPDDKIEQGGELRISCGQELDATFLRPHRVYRFRVAPENSVGRATPSAWSIECVTPSLVEFTVTRYFANRPGEEHSAARTVQRVYRAWRQAAADRMRFTNSLMHALEHWHIL